MALRLQPCREAFRPVAQRQPRLERGAVLGGGGSLVLGIIRLPDAAARTEDAVRKVAVVRQQQQALRLLVQPPHRRHAELPVSLRDQLHHRPVARIVRRGHVARRLVQHQQDFPVFFDRRAVHRNGTCRLVKFFRFLTDDCTVHGHAPRADEAFQLLAGGDARLREDLVEPLHCTQPLSSVIIPIFRNRLYHPEPDRRN